MKTILYISKIILRFLFIFLIACQKTPTGTEEQKPKGSPPATPAIMQVNPSFQEPNRGMLLTINDASDNEEGFSIERKTYGGTFSPLTNLPANSQSYDDWGVQMSTSYTYRIKAYNQYGSSNWSAEKTEISIGPITSTITPLIKVSTDAYVSSANAGKNYGIGSFVRIAGGDGYWGSNHNILLLFSLPKLPNHAKDFQSAYLYLNEAGGGNTIYPGLIEIFAAPILDTWSENTVTWSNRPGTLVSTYGKSSHNPNANPTIKIDVSQVVSDWYKGTRANRGFMLFSGSKAYCDYYSREGYQSGSGQLEIKYTW